MLDTTKPDRFPACLRETLKWEGGYSNHPKDPGGATMKGVIQRVYNGWRDAQGLQRRSVKLIEPHEVEAIYRQNYWAAVRGDELPAGLDLAVWDYGVNSGPSRAVKALQKVTGTVADGHMGAATLAAAQRHDPADLVAKYMAERQRFLRSLGTFPVFGKGWMNRCAAIKAKALVMAGESPLDLEPAPVPLPNPEAQSETQGRATAEDPKPPVGTQVTLAIGGVGGVGTEISTAFTTMTARADYSLRGFLFALLSSPTFWVSVIAIVGAFYTMLWRWRHA